VRHDACRSSFLRLVFILQAVTYPSMTASILRTIQSIDKLELAKVEDSDACQCISIWDVIWPCLVSCFCGSYINDIYAAAKQLLNRVGLDTGD
jgi:hypothetical protein